MFSSNKEPPKFHFRVILEIQNYFEVRENNRGFCLVIYELFLTFGQFHEFIVQSESMELAGKIQILQSFYFYFLKSQTHY